MLDINKTSELYTSGKVTRDPNVAGRFIYHVAADRASERTGSTIKILNPCIVNKICIILL